MAKRVQVVLEDDVDGSLADETVSFGLDGVSYEIDLSAANASALRDQLAKWIGAAQRTGGRRAVARRGAGLLSPRCAPRAGALPGASA